MRNIREQAERRSSRRWMRSIAWPQATLAAALLAVGAGGAACGDDDAGGSAARDARVEGDGSRRDAGASTRDGALACAACDVPVAPAALQTWLATRQYEGFAHEAAVKSSEGPHGKVRVFVNPLLAESLAAGASSHPLGAAAIKELYAQDGTTLSGWAVEVKVAASSDSGGRGKGWYWYEAFGTSASATPEVSALGAAGCTGCHAEGRDYVTTTWPLR